MAVISLVITRVNRRGVSFIRAAMSKNLSVFNYDAERESLPQYKEVAEMLINKTREEFKNFSLDVISGPVDLPDAFDYEGVVYLLNIERKI